MMPAALTAARCQRSRNAFAAEASTYGAGMKKGVHAHLVHLATPATHGERVRELVQPLIGVADPGEREVVRGRHVLRGVVLQRIPVRAGGGRCVARPPPTARMPRMQQPARRGLQALEQARGSKSGQRDRERVTTGGGGANVPRASEQALDIRLRLELYELAFTEARDDAHYLFLRRRVVAELLEQQRPGLVDEVRPSKRPMSS